MNRRRRVDVADLGPVAWGQVRAAGIDPARRHKYGARKAWACRQCGLFAYHDEPWVLHAHQTRGSGACPGEPEGFDSGAEARHWLELCRRDDRHEIVDLQRQVPYRCTINGVEVCTYFADFSYYDVLAHRDRVIDVKGFDTPVSRLKRRLVRALYGVEIEIVTDPRSRK